MQNFVTFAFYKIFKPIRAKRYIDVVQLVLITDIRKIVKSYQTLTPKL